MNAQNKRGGPVSRVLYGGRRRRPPFGGAPGRHAATSGRYSTNRCAPSISAGRHRPARAAYPQAGGSLLDGPSTCCSALLLARFTVPPLSPATRWALTPPFHPHRQTLGRTGAPPAVCFLWHCLSAAPSDAAARALPGAMPLWSPDFPPPVRPRGRLAAVHRPASHILRSAPRGAVARPFRPRPPAGAAWHGG